MSSPETSLSSPDSFEGHRLQFLKILGLSPSTTRIPSSSSSTPPIQLQYHQQSNNKNQNQNNNATIKSDDDDAQAKEDAMWTFVGNVTEELRSFSSPVVVVPQSINQTDGYENDDLPSNIPVVERQVSRSVDTLMLLSRNNSNRKNGINNNTNQSNNKSATTTTPSRNLLHLSPSRALSKQELEQNQKSGGLNARQKRANSSLIIAKGKKLPGSKQTIAGKEISSSSLSETNTRIRSLAFKSPSRWKHTSSFDIHAFLPADTVVDFNEEEAKALEKMMKEEEEAERKRLGKSEKDATIISAEVSSISTSSSLTEPIIHQIDYSKNVLDQSQVSQSLIEATQVIKKLVRALRIEREVNTNVTTSSNNNNNNSNNTAIGDEASKAEAYLKKFHSRYDYLYPSETKDDEFEREKLTRDLRNRVKELELEKQRLNQKHEEELNTMKTQLTNSMMNQRHRFDAARPNQQQQHNNHHHLTPNYAAPISRTRTPPATTSSNNSHHHQKGLLNNFTFSSASGPTAAAAATGTMQRSASNLSTLSRKTSTLTARPKKGEENNVYPQQQQNKMEQQFSGSISSIEFPTLTIANDHSHHQDEAGDSNASHQKPKKNDSSLMFNDAGFGIVLDSASDDDDPMQSSKTSSSVPVAAVVAVTTETVVNAQQKSADDKPTHHRHQQMTPTEKDAEIDLLRKMNRELRDSLESAISERDLYQAQLNDAMKELVGTDSKTLKNGQQMKTTVTAAIEALMTQVKTLSAKNRMLEEKIIKTNTSSSINQIQNKDSNSNVNPPHHDLNHHFHHNINSNNNTNVRSTSSATIMSVQSTTTTPESKIKKVAGTTATIQTPTSSTKKPVVSSSAIPQPKRSPMAVKSLNPKSVAASTTTGGIVPSFNNSNAAKNSASKVKDGIEQQQNKNNREESSASSVSTSMSSNMMSPEPRQPF